MPSFRGHLIGYLVLSVIAIAALFYYKLIQADNAIDLLPAFLLGGVYALLPDIDTPASKIRTITNILGGILIVSMAGAYLLYQRDDRFLYGIILVAVIQVALYALKHRGFTHSLLFGLIAVAPIAYLNQTIGLLAAIGFLSHIVFDALHL
jgi:membrane-bound metal-dependent hydrolase YbcI (DUF457 family)